MELQKLLTKIETILKSKDLPEEKFQDILMQMVNEDIKKYNFILFILKH